MHTIGHLWPSAPAPPGHTQRAKLVDTLRTRRADWAWWGLWVLSFLIGAGILTLYAWLPVDGATGDLSSFSPEGFRVQWLLERRPGGLQVGDLIVRAGGHTADEWLQGAPRGPEWHTGGIVTYEILRNGQPTTLHIQMTPTSLGAYLAHWWPQLIVCLAFLAIGTLVLWKRPYELAARLLMLICVMTVLQHLGDGYNFQFATLAWGWPFWLHLALEHITFGVTYASVAYFALIFPSVHPLVSRFPRLVPVTLYTSFFAIKYAVSALYPTWSTALEGGNRAAVAMSVGMTAIAIAAFFRSVRIARDPVTRAQVRWIIWVGSITVMVVLPGYLLPLMLIGRPLIPPPVSTLLTASIPFTFAVIILRYRLWDIDIIINRTLVYGSLTAMLTLTYFGGVILLQQVFTILIGHQSNLAIIISTLVIAALFQPLRRRWQTFIDRRFYRQKVDSRQALLTFSREVRTIIDLSDLLHMLVDRVTDLLYIEHGAVLVTAANDASRWKQAYSRPAESAAWPLELDTMLRRRLHKGEIVYRPENPVFPLLVPLLAPRVDAQDLVGILALGPRLSGQGYSSDDQALLTGLADQAGTALHVAQLLADKQVEARHKEAAEAVSQAKTDFLANMSLGVRTPLNTIIGYSKLLYEQARDRGYTDLETDLSKIQIAGRHLLTLVSGILDFSRTETGEIELYPERFDLETLVRDVVATSQPLVWNQGNVLQVETAPDLGTMVADLAKVRQILLNLLSNAAKFTHQGRITFTTARETTPEGTAWIRFRVTDTGIGMTPEQMRGLFQPFTQIDSAITRQHGGTGLGLAISQRFCRMMGGEIYVESQVGRGTTFTVHLPVEAGLQTGSISRPQT